MSENLTFGVKFTAEDFEKAEELDFAGRLKLCCEKFGAPYPSGIPDVYADGEDPAALIKLDESFFVLELWQDRQVSLAVQSGDFIVTVACLFSAYVDLVCAEEITAGEQISFAVAEKMTAFKNIAEKIPAVLPVSIVSADHADENTLEEVNGRIFDEYGYISSRNTSEALHACECVQDEDDQALVVVVSPDSPYDSVEFALRSIGQKPSGDRQKDNIKLESFTALPVPEN